MVDKGHKSVSDDTQKSTVVSQRQACCSPIMPMGKIINYLIRFTALDESLTWSKWLSQSSSEIT